MDTVARAAGVHQTTVSLALRDHPRIPQETRDRIKAIATKLGYRTNPYVSAFVASRHRGRRIRRATLGYVTADKIEHGGRGAISDYADLYSGAKQRAEELGYGIDHLWLGDPKLTSARFHQITETRNIHGLLIAPMAVKSHTLDIDWRRFAVVAYGFSMSEPHVHRVVPDFYHSMIDLLGRCRAAGYRRIGLVLDNNSDRKNDHLWLAPFIAEPRFTPGATSVEPLLLPAAWDGQLFDEWYASQKPDVIVALNKVFRKVEVWAQARNLKTGRDLQLVMLNVTENPGERGSAGVYLDRRRAGAACVEQLAAMLNRNEKGIPSSPHTLLIETGWSSGPTFSDSRVRDSRHE